MILNSEFKPAYGLSNSHIQTILPTLLRTGRTTDYLKQTLELEDGDFLDIAWTNKHQDGKPLVVVFHGLEGSIESPYAQGIMQVIKQHGWTGLLMHFRGCSGRVNRLPRSYHSGDTGDAKFLIHWLNQHYATSPVAAVGFSLGGNMLLKLVGELGAKSPFKATVSVSAPLLLNACADRLKQGFSKIYQRRLISDLRQKLILKADKHDYKKIINLDHTQINQLKNFWQFDDLVTAPLHGFDGVDDYYCRSSSRQYLKDIRTPTLLLQARDDPFMSIDVIPAESELSEYIQLELSQHGGHVGFISGNLINPVFWLEKRIPEYLKQFI